MKVIVCNIGSSSLKFQLLEMPAENLLARGHIERVGSDLSAIHYFIGSEKVNESQLALPSHREAVQNMLDFLVQPEYALLKNLDKIDAVGFKTIQAGDKNGSVLLTPDVLEAMAYYKNLAPAHNPPYLTAIHRLRELLPDAPLVGVFEPGFHLDAPDYAKVYGTPIDWLTEFGVKKYGYHGASHRFVTAETVRILGLPANAHKIITCHLGGSSSLCAFKNGVSIDTSMGFTPQSGLIQGTRIGDMDPYVLPYIMDKKGLTLEQALQACAKEAGLAGLSGTSGDMRDIKAAIAKGCTQALLARNKFIYDIKRYLGEFLVLMEGLDAVTFTGGIGEKDAELRHEILQSLHFLGCAMDTVKNEKHDTIISTQRSKIAALVLETNEEIVVARETVAVVQGLN